MLLRDAWFIPWRISLPSINLFMDGNYSMASLQWLWLPNISPIVQKITKALHWHSFQTTHNCLNFINTGQCHPSSAGKRFLILLIILVIELNSSHIGTTRPVGAHFCQTYLLNTTTPTCTLSDLGSSICTNHLHVHESDLLAIMIFILSAKWMQICKSLVKVTSLKWQ